MFSLCRDFHFNKTRNALLDVVLTTGSLLATGWIYTAVPAGAFTDSRQDFNAAGPIAQAEPVVGNHYTVEIIPPVDGKSLGLIIYRPANGGSGPAHSFGGPR